MHHEHQHYIEHGNVKQWYESYDNVTFLGGALVDAGYTVQQLQWYYERPYRYDAEWSAFTAGGQEALERSLFEPSDDMVEPFSAPF